MHGIDWYPKQLEPAGVPLPARQIVDGVSLVPLLKGGSIPDRPLFWHYPHSGNQGGEPSSIVQDGGWKLIHCHEDGRDELYRLADDPGEQTDLAAAQPGRAKALRATLDAWLRATGARLPSPDPEFDPAKRAARLEQVRTQGRAQLEKQHAGFLAPDFKPDKDWRGSAPQD